MSHRFKKPLRGFPPLPLKGYRKHKVIEQEASSPKKHLHQVIRIYDEVPCWDGAIALEDSVLLCLEKKRFVSLISQRPHIILEI